MFHGLLLVNVKCGFKKLHVNRHQCLMVAAIAAANHARHRQLMLPGKAHHKAVALKNSIGGHIKVTQFVILMNVDAGVINNEVGAMQIDSHLHYRLKMAQELVIARFTA